MSERIDRLAADIGGSMGRMANPLDGFQSYSTHFIMIAARTTTQAKSYAEAAGAERLSAVAQAMQLGQAIPWKGSKSDLYLVIDTRRFSQFTVQKMNYEVLINGLQVGGVGNLATEISMTILDSVGISFMNYLQWLLDTRMQTNFDGMIFLLEVVFVGHNHDGTTQTVHSVTIPMHLFSMNLNLDFAKGIYECVFMPNMNFSANHHNRWLQIGTATSYYASKNTLGEMIDSFENSLNAASSTFFTEMRAKILQSGAAPQDGRPGEFGRLVMYQITIPEQWKTMIFTGGSVGEALEREFPKKAEKEAAGAKGTSTDATPAKDGFLSVDPGLTIPMVLETMFKQVAEINAMANADRLTSKDANVSFYKFLVGVTSDTNSFTVHVDVVPFEVPNVAPPRKDVNRETTEALDRNYIMERQADGSEIRRPKSYFELDYIFTGRNVDILSFDMKIQDLNFLLASNVNVGEGAIFNVQGNGQGEVLDENGKPLPKPELLSARQYDPIMMPLVSPEQRTNFSEFATARQSQNNKKLINDAQAYSKNLSAFYAQSPVMVNIIIKGNPLIMDKFNFASPLEHTSPATLSDRGLSATNLTVKDSYRRNLETQILKQGGTANSNGTFSVPTTLGSESYVTSPVFVKLNIKGPNVDFVTGTAMSELVNGQAFATEVLYNNYYVVFKVINSIESGVFTQEIEMWSHNVYGTGKLTQEQTQSKNPRQV